MNAWLRNLNFRLFSSDEFGLNLVWTQILSKFPSNLKFPIVELLTPDQFEITSSIITSTKLSLPINAQKGPLLMAMHKMLFSNVKIWIVAQAVENDYRSMFMSIETHVCFQCLMFNENCVGFLFNKTQHRTVQHTTSKIDFWAWRR